MKKYSSLRLLVFGLMRASLWHGAMCYTLNANSASAPLIPNILNTVGAPKIAEDANQVADRLSYRLKIECSEQAKTFFKFEPRNDFCKGFLLKGTATEINNILDHVLVTCPPMEPQQLGSITYILWSEKAPNQTVTFLQNFSLEAEMPVKVLQDVVMFDAAKSQNINEHLLSIDKRVIDYQTDYQFELDITNSEVPKWMAFNVVGYDLVLTGEPPKHFDENLNFLVSVYDHKSGLKSRQVGVNIITVRNVDLDNFFIGFAIFFVCFCLLVVGLVVICVVKSSSYVNIEQHKARADESDASVIKNVLSSSITNWTSSSAYEKLSTRDTFSVLGHNPAEYRQGVNDSIYELEALKADLGPAEPIRGHTDRSFMEDSSLAHIVDFGNISKIEKDKEAAGLGGVNRKG